MAKCGDLAGEKSKLKLASNTNFCNAAILIKMRLLLVQIAAENRILRRNQNAMPSAVARHHDNETATACCIFVRGMCFPGEHIRTDLEQ
jgi:hypothetical protein